MGFQKDEKPENRESSPGPVMVSYALLCSSCGTVIGFVELDAEHQDLSLKAKCRACVLKDVIMKPLKEKMSDREARMISGASRMVDALFEMTGLKALLHGGEFPKKTEDEEGYHDIS